VRCRSKLSPEGGRPLDIIELTRLDALDQFEVLDTPPEPEFDRVVHLAARLFRTPAAAISLIDEQRLWFKAKVGIEASELPRSASFCTHTIAAPGVMVVLDASQDARFRDTPPSTRGYAFYAGASLMSPSGERIGTLFVLDHVSHANFSADDEAALADLAVMVSQQLEHRRRNLALERANQRTVRTDAMMHTVADAATCEQALVGVLARLCNDHGAAAGYIWKLARPDHVLREVSRNLRPGMNMDAHFELARTLGIKPGSSLAADAIICGTPRTVRFAGVADLGRYPMVASAMRHGLLCQVIQPIHVSGERFAVTLSFDVDRTDLDAVLSDVGSLVDTIRPALYRKVAEERMYLLSIALDRANDAVMITEELPHEHAGPRIAYVNSSFCRATGYALKDVIGQSPRLLLGPDADHQTQGQFAQALQQWTPTRTEMQHCRKDGSHFWVEMDVTPIADDSGWQTHWISIQRDITERRRLDEERREREASNRKLFEQSPLPTLVFDRRSLRFLDVNSAAVTQYGWTRAQFLQMSLPDVQTTDEQPAFGSLIASNHNVEIARRSWTHLRANGSRIQVQVASHALTYAGEDAIMAVLQDVTEVEAAQRAMQEANLRLADLAGQLQARTADLTEVHRLARLGTWRRSLDRTEGTWSDEMYDVMAMPKTGSVPSYEDFLQRVHPDDRAAVRAMQDDATTTCTARQIDFRVVLPQERQPGDRRSGNARPSTVQSGSGQAGDGLRHCRLDARPMLDEAGAVIGLYGYCQDITAHKQIEMALLRSEKLKSIGQLTGGIAHDFNNLLTVVSLNLEEAIEMTPPGAPLQEILQPAMHAAQRGAELTKQLLSYARRATLRPEQVELSGFFRSLTPLLTRTLGKRFDLQLEMRHNGTAFVDPAQLENALLNLVINARDAMPDGGIIRVETSLAVITAAHGDGPDDLAPGSYLLASVSDNGSGIPPGVLSHVFEPFFTTKDVGRGSGLGLSMVYGFAKQSGGHVVITSEVGVGTTVRLFLPLVNAAEPPAPAVTSPAWQRRGLRALVVDDEPDVLSTAARMLSNMGLEVKTAGTAEDAAAQLSEGFDLLFSDVRLPGPVDGVRLAAQARAQMPGISVLLTSGYTDRSAADLDDPEGGLPGDTKFLPKPYTRQALHAALTALLG